MEAFVPWKKTRIADKGRGSASNATPDVDSRRNNKGKMTSTGSQSIASDAAGLRRPVLEVQTLGTGLLDQLEDRNGCHQLQGLHI